MTEPAIILVLLGILLLGSWLWVRSYRRRRVFARLAYRMRFRVSCHLDYDLPGSLADLYCMQRGHDQRACHVVRGRCGDFECTAFDYRYDTGLGSNRVSHLNSVVLWEGKHILPSMVMLRNNTFYPMGKFSSFVPVTGRNPDIDNVFTLYSDQPNKVPDVLTDELLSVLLRCRYANWEFHNRCIVSFSDRPLSAWQLHRLVRRGLRIAQLLST